MKPIGDFLADLRELDIRLWLDGGAVRCDAPKGVLTPSLKSAIAERKEEITGILSKNNILSTTSLKPIIPLLEKGHLPLSFAQQRLWFLDRLQPESSFYNVPMAYRIRGPLDIEALKESLNEIIRRHEALRTVFVEVEGEPQQVVRPAEPLKLPVNDLQELPDAEKEAAIKRFVSEESSRPFDLAKGPLLRVRLLQLGAEDHVLLVLMHHIITDGWSMGIFFRELTRLYEAYSEGRDSPLSELPIQYADYAVWQRGWLQGDVLEQQLFYWKDQLGGLGVLELPADRPRPPMQTYRGSHESFAIDRPLAEGLISLSRKNQTTLFMTLLAAFQTLLYRYTGKQDISVGSPIANRQRAEIEDLIGFFVNTLVLRSDLSGNPTFRDLLKRVRRLALDAYARQDLPFEKLVEELQPERNASVSPLFQVMFVMQNASRENLQLGELTMKPFAVETNTAKFDLTLNLTETEGNLYGSIGYNTDLFNSSTITRLIGHFQTLLAGIVANPDQHLSALPLLTRAEQEQLLMEWNATASVYPRNTCIHTLFEAQAAQTPDAVAVVFGDRQLTYRELNGRANRLAHYLQKIGVGPDVTVGICLDRSLEMMVGLLGILKAGGAYVPLDPQYPVERLAFMLEDAQVHALLTQKDLLKLFSGIKTEVVCLDCEQKAILNESVENPALTVNGRNLAYIIYTSGSTGRPKGVAIEHRSVVALSYWAKEIFDLEDISGLLAVTSICFDISVFELFFPIGWGGKVIIANNILELPSISSTQQIKLINTVPSAIKELLTGWDIPDSVRVINLAGEPLRTSLVKQICQQSKVLRVIDLYGPSEDTVYSTFALRDDNKPATIGRPITNSQVYILDNLMQPVPVGAIGELFTGGDGLARGYRSRPELTAEKFIPDPFSSVSGSRLYRTGDLARYLPDGNIEFLGRIDHQVKIRGFRIETGEIEAVLNSHPALSDCVVMTQEEETGDKRLVAYVVSNADRELTTSELSRFVGEKLPGYMIPAFFITLDALPLTPSGKIDRKALPVPDHGRPELTDKYVPPKTEVERIVAEIWSSVLGLEKLGVHDNFFELGGHSLLATKVVSQANRIFQIDVPLKTFFETPTVAGLAVHIQDSINPDQPQAIAIECVLRNGSLPLSFAQQRLWFLDRLQTGNSFYNVPESYRIRGPLDIEALKESLNEIVRRHEALRTVFVEAEEEPQQVVRPVEPLELPVSDLQELPDAEKEAAIKRFVSEESSRPFDLAKGPLLRVKLLLLGAEDHVLLVLMHHIITDGWSMGIFFRELTRLYESYSQGKDSSLPELPIQYADYAVWQRGWLQGDVLEQQLFYWKDQLGGLGVLELPTDRPRPPIQTYRGSHESFAIDRPLAEGLISLSRKNQTTLFMTLLAAFQTLLYRYTGKQDISVGSPIANRQRAEIEDLIGFFVNTLVLRSDLSGNPTFRDLLKRVRRLALDAYAHQDLPFEKLVEELQPERNASVSPLFQVMFVMQNAPRENLQLGELTMKPFAVETNTAKFDLTLNLTETEGNLYGSIGYNTDLFDRSTITRLIGHFQTLLAGIVANPDQTLSELPLLTQAEQEQLLVEWNATASEYPRGTCIHALFEAQAEKTPDAVAVVFGDHQLTYRELNDRANRLAHYLQKIGVEPPDVPVGICLDRSLEMVTGIIGILKVGGAYVPLDPEYPKERLSFMARDAGIRLLLTSSGLSGLLPELDIPVVYLDDEMPCTGTEELPAAGTRASNLAYIMYTSGSTGVPKGTEVTHGNVVRLITNTNYVSLDSSTILLHYAPLAFDASTFEIWGPLLNGGRLVVCPPGPLTLHELGQIIASEQVNTIWLTAALFHTVVENNSEMLGPVRQLLAGGDVLSAAAVKKALGMHENITLINGYGPTENTTFTCCYPMSKPSQVGDKVPIGRPIANTTAYILDRCMQPVPVGTVGELYTGGDGVARGYHNRPDLTEEKFIPDPFSSNPGARLYKTGDLARYRTDGNIEFLGRIDHQVKIRGFRIEPGEIEAVLGLHGAISECVVVVQKEEPGDKRLVAYVVSSRGSELTSTELRRFVSEKLPEYMIPALFIMLDVMPLTPNGKIDRKALPAPEHRRPEPDKGFTAPRTPIEEKLCEIWADLLDLEKVGIHDNFFELGGYSLLAVRVFDRIRQEFGQELPLTTLFQGGTIAQLATVLQGKPVANIQSSIVPIQPYGSEIPLFFLHNLAEGVFFPRRLIHHLGSSHPVYCFQAIHKDWAPQVDHCIETMAERYVDDLIRYYPTVGYCLIGYSFGGFLAYEMARQLHMKNKKIALLAIIDTGPSTGRPNTLGGKLQHIYRVTANLPLWFHDALFHRNRKEFADRLLRKISAARKKLHNKITGKKGLSIKDNLEDIFEQYRLKGHQQAIMEMHYRALVNYKPKPYPGHMTLFRSRTRPPFHSLEPDLGWGDLILGNIDIKHIPGNHLSILNEPDVKMLTERFKECLLQLKKGHNQ